MHNQFGDSNPNKGGCSFKSSQSHGGGICRQLRGRKNKLTLLSRSEWRLCECPSLVCITMAWKDVANPCRMLDPTTFQAQPAGLIPTVYSGPLQ